MIEIGQVIANREIYAIFEKKYCLARALNLIGPEPYTVWLIDADGNGVNSGRYYKEQMDAEWDFAARCFGWFEDNMMIVDPEEQRNAPEVVAPEQTPLSIDIKRMTENAASKIQKERAPGMVAPERALGNVDILAGLERLRVLLNIRDKLISDLSGLQPNEKYEELEKSILNRIYSEIQDILEFQSRE